MEKTLNNANDILYNNISGFHAYSLNDPVHLLYVSNNLLKTVGYSESELLSETEDLYLQLVHPADRKKYSEFINSLKAGDKSLTLQYRLVKKNGAVLYVNDAASSETLSDGSINAYSVLSDITEIQRENENLTFFIDTVPCGFLKYTCTKQPEITYMNRQMMDFLRFPKTVGGELDFPELYKENIFLLIPMEERRRFALYLNRVYTTGVPIAGELELLRCDGTRMYVFGWLAKCVNENGDEEFQSVCMDVTERHYANKMNQAEHYLKALTDIYDKIFEYDLSTNTVKCLYAQSSFLFKWLENIPMQMEEATEKWITGTVVPEEREAVRSYFYAFRQKKLYKAGEKPPQISYRALSSSGEVKHYNGVFLKMDETVSLYCCRSVSDFEEIVALRNENVSLKENMQELVMQFTEGIAAFEVSDKYVTPLYASDNVCEFFGFTREEWLPLMKKSTLIKDFVSRSQTEYRDFEELLRNSEAEFTYYDCNNKTERRIKAICSPKSAGISPRFILLYNIDDTENKSSDEDRTVYIRTFGYFDVFVGDKPIAFRNKKSKELFALLVDRRGGFVSSEDAISFLWEDEPVNSVTLARYRKVALRLKNILEEYGIAEVVETVDGKRRIVMDKVHCDLYDYLSGKEEFSQLFKGSYLTNYSWGETTLAELSGNNVY